MFNMCSGNIESNFIVFEGIDGAGKSSLIRFLSNVLYTKGHTVFSTSEPSDSDAGALIRTILSEDDGTTPIHSSLFAYLYAADRYEHVYGNNGINKQFKTHDVILCDRYLFSSYVYQGYSQELLELTISLNKDFPLPSILFYLDINIENSLNRLKQRTEHTKESLHSNVENSATLTQVQDRYHSVIENFSQQQKTVQCYHLDANKTIETLCEECLTFINPILARKIV